MGIKASSFLISENRTILSEIMDAIADKMVFIGGPRQVGKTTLSLHIMSKILKLDVDRDHPCYLNWDVTKSRKVLLSGELPSGSKILILDEVHKYKKWRNLVKGYFDASLGKRSLIVTGSARLDYYRKGGDSLQGRYRYFRLHPYSWNEVSGTSKSDLQALLKFGGFPEPLTKQSEKFSRLWHKDRVERVVYDDLRDLETVKEISLVDHLVEALPARVASVLSIKALREDLQVSHESVERWISILERLYYCFRIPPFGSAKIRAVKKEQKLYLWDWSILEEIGQKFENMVASQLLKYCQFLEDTEGYKMELRFIRDIDSREIDFVVLKNKKPLFAVECKSGERAIAKAIHYFSERTAIPMFYQVHLGERDYEDVSKKIRVLPFTKFCEELKLP